MKRVSLLLFAMTLFSGCSPGLFLNLYNGSEEILRVTIPSDQRVVTILPGKAADIWASGYVRIEHTSSAWTYAPGLIAPPTEYFEKHGMVWRAFGRIDSHGRVFILVPDGQPQPTGFPFAPQKTIEKHS